jgi:hypothetical protein
MMGLLAGARSQLRWELRCYKVCLSRGARFHVVALGARD